VHIFTYIYMHIPNKEDEFADALGAHGSCAGRISQNSALIVMLPSKFSRDLTFEHFYQIRAARLKYQHSATHCKKVQHTAKKCNIPDQSCRVETVATECPHHTKLCEREREFVCKRECVKECLGVCVCVCVASECFHHTRLWVRVRVCVWERECVCERVSPPY